MASYNIYPLEMNARYITSSKRQSEPTRSTSSDCHVFVPLRELLVGKKFSTDIEIKEDMHCWSSIQTGVVDYSSLRDHSTLSEFPAQFLLSWGGGLNQFYLQCYMLAVLLNPPMGLTHPPRARTKVLLNLHHLQAFLLDIPMDSDV